MSDLNELFAELKNEVDEKLAFEYGAPRHDTGLEALYKLDELINNGDFARAEQDAYIG